MSYLPINYDISKYKTHKLWKEWDDKGRLKSVYSEFGFALEIFYKDDLVGHIQTRILKSKYINNPKIDRNYFKKLINFNDYIIERHDYEENVQGLVDEITSYFYNLENYPEEYLNLCLNFFKEIKIEIIMRRVLDLRLKNFDGK